MGPAPHGDAVDCSGKIIEADEEVFYKPQRAMGSSQEIMKDEAPHTRYGVGVLYPAPTANDSNDTEGEIMDVAEVHNGEIIAQVLDEKAAENLETGKRKLSSAADVADDESSSLSLANTMRPASMGVSFLIDLSKIKEVRIRIKGGTYSRREARMKEKDRTRQWWVRSTFHEVLSLDLEYLMSKNGRLLPITLNSRRLSLKLECISRPDPLNPDDTSRRLVTICLVNRTTQTADDGRSLDARCLFQCRFKILAIGTNDKLTNSILPYPEARINEPDEEEQSLALLYRKLLTFATGHGCSADWNAKEGDQFCSQVSAVPFPVQEVPSTTPDITREDGSKLTVSMKALAGLDPHDDGLASLEEVVSRYGSWIQELEEISLPEKLQPAAAIHLKECKRAQTRMREGIRHLRDKPQILEAFRLANHAILLQQIRSGQKVRRAQITDGRFRFTEAEPPNPLSPPTGRGLWRPFQIAFLLMSLPSMANGSSPDRKTVELIWFPTGGGKTEAYLGITAFTIFLRRLRNPEDSGTDVLMRYTLRLLTAQQFQRASGLICAMDYLRQDQAKKGKNLGGEISIGIWLGGDTTPNSRDDARSKLTRLEKGKKETEYPFVLLKCPWCCAEIGPLEGRRDQPFVIGLERTGSRSVGFRCADRQCHFHSRLPVLVVDEDIYENPPELVIGTVDKFASLAWKPNARSLFGIGPEGDREKSPPGLIIQDELHLISGPLGSVSGLYECVIEELCTDRRPANQSDHVPPKIISSTATARCYRKQIKDLYAREDAALFPPPGLDISDSFFSNYARDPDSGELAKGRQYVGVLASSGLSHIAAQRNTFATLLQATQLIKEKEERDPWHTLLTFFNSLRELGGGLTLYQQDIPERIYQIRERFGGRYRKIFDCIELTGRIKSGDVPKSLEKLERVVGRDDYPVDACLASNIIEVGIDVDRMSLMSVVGQPKTTSQYIQVTGRVGRKWWERPGLIVTIYGASKSRDRSHYEKFRTYHQQLYAQVEPASITPFTHPAMERALHAVMTSFVRQFSPERRANNPQSANEGDWNKIAELLIERVKIVEPSEEGKLHQWLDKRIADWKRTQTLKWNPGMNDDTPSFLRYPGSYYPSAWKGVSWDTPTSMRTVDAECLPKITTLYQHEDLPIF